MKYLILALALPLVASADGTFEGYLTLESNRVYISSLPDGLALRYEVKWRRTMPANLCFRNQSLHCPRAPLRYRRITGRGPARALIDAELASR